ncbi:MAG: NAD-dependent deacylase [Marinilabiliales bacterium]|nr:MAG: NAD-dependent deacylase [Marinilabiliales bacterium]
MEKLVVLSGAGISAESGIKTFRDMGGLWEEYDIMEVASPEGWARNPKLVQKFYNDRRRQLLDCKPNRAHLLLVELEKFYDVEVVTQNVDDLHERAGSSRVLHLHGELRKAQSTHDPSLVYDIEGWEIKETDRCEKGYPLRPNVVWFGEPVYAMEPAMDIVSKAGILVVIGTSLNVYPAAGLVDYVPDNCSVYLIDPNEVMYYGRKKVNFIKEKAGKGTGILFEQLTGEKPPF